MAITATTTNFTSGKKITVTNDSSVVVIELLVYIDYVARTYYIRYLLSPLSEGQITTDILIPQYFEELFDELYTVLNAEIPLLTQLATPANFTATAVSTSQINLVWDSVVSATTYVLETADDPTFVTNLVTIYSGGSTSYSHTGLDPAEVKYYRVRATASGYLDSDYAEDDASTMTQLAAPENLNTSAPPTSTQIDLVWDSVTDAQTYTLQRALDAGFTSSLTTVYTGSATSYSNTGLTPSTSYYYRVKAVAAGFVDSDWSTALSTGTTA